MKKCEDCDGFGIEEVPQPHGGIAVLDCGTCGGSGCMLETDQEYESARMSEMIYENT